MYCTETGEQQSILGHGVDHSWKWEQTTKQAVNNFNIEAVNNVNKQVVITFNKHNANIVNNKLSIISAIKLYHETSQEFCKTVANSLT